MRPSYGRTWCGALVAGAMLEIDLGELLGHFDRGIYGSEEVVRRGRDPMVRILKFPLMLTHAPSAKAA